MSTESLGMALTDLMVIDGLLEPYDPLCRGALVH